MSDLLNQASLVYIPSGYKEDTAYSVIPTDGSGDLTFTRASDGTRVNSQGLVERVPWNLLQYSNTFNNAIWIKGSSISVTSGQTGYDGTSNAWLLSKSAIQYPSLGQSLVNNGFTTLSVYAKANTNTNICLFASSSPSNKYQDFNLSNGTLGTNASGVVNATITSVGNGWYFCVVTFNGNTTTFDIFPDIIDGANAGSIYIQNAQLNEGSTAKPYFPTTDRQNVPRLDYSNGCPSLLLEPQRTNLFIRSEEFNTSWVVTGGSVTANQATSPDGTQNADLLTGEIYQQPTQANNTTYIFSLYVKKDTATTLYIGYIDNVIGFTGGSIVYTYSTGAISINQSANASVSGEAFPVGNGWIRLVMKFTTIASVTFNYHYIGSAGSYIWGAQLEAGSYPTSYIPTTSASVTRVADAASKTGISSLIGQTEGTIFLDINHRYLASYPNEYLVNLKDGTNQIWLRKESGGSNLTARLVVGGTNIWTISVNAIDGRNKIALVYKSTDSVVYLNGSQVSTSSSSYSGLTLADFYFNAVGSANPETKINQAVLFKTRLTNAELAALTTL